MSNQSKHSTYHGIYTVKNFQKYIGSKNPKFKSSWERRFCSWCDENENVVRWGYECLRIPYFFAVDGQSHGYFVDFYCEIRNKDEVIKKYAVEIKPKKQSNAPIKPKINNNKALRRYAIEKYHYLKNQNKWQAAEKYCRANDMKFVILTEQTIF